MENSPYGKQAYEISDLQALIQGVQKNVPITKSLLGGIFAKLQIPTATKS